MLIKIFTEIVIYKHRLNGGFYFQTLIASCKLGTLALYVQHNIKGYCDTVFTRTWLPSSLPQPLSSSVVSSGNYRQ